MKPVIVASVDSNEAQEIKRVLENSHEVNVVNSADMLENLMNDSEIVILDHSFYEQYGLDFLMDLFTNPHPQFFMLSPPEEIDAIVKTMEIGIQYIPKVPDYQKLLSVAANNALKQIHEQEQLRHIITGLTRRVDELSSHKGQLFPGERPHEAKANMLDEVVFVFKRGEIELPAIPALSLKFQEMMKKGANLREIGELLKQDMAVSSKLISVSNSAFYRGLVESKNVANAISRLGLKNTKRYVDAICNRSLYTSKNKRFLSLLQRLWEHSLACAYASQILADARNIELENDAFTMGLLHDIGRLLLLQIIADLQLKKKIGDVIDGAELTNTIDMNHGKFGAALLENWNFSESIIKVAAYHDNLKIADSINNDLLVVNFSNLMVKSMGFSPADQGDDPNDEVDLENIESAHLLKLDASIIEGLKTRVSEFMKELRILFI